MSKKTNLSSKGRNTTAAQDSSGFGAGEFGGFGGFQSPLDGGMGFPGDNIDDGFGASFNFSDDYFGMVDSATKFISPTKSQGGMGIFPQPTRGINSISGGDMLTIPQQSRHQSFGDTGLGSSRSSHQNRLQQQQQHHHQQLHHQQQLQQCDDDSPGNHAQLVLTAPIQQTMNKIEITSNEITDLRETIGQLIQQRQMILDALSRVYFSPV